MLSSLPYLKSPLPTGTESSSSTPSASRLGSLSPNTNTSALFTNSTNNNNNKGGSSAGLLDNHSNSTSAVYCAHVHAALSTPSAMTPTSNNIKNDNNSINASALPALSNYTTSTITSESLSSFSSIISTSTTSLHTRVRSPSYSNSGAIIAACSTNTQPKTTAAASSFAAGACTPSHQQSQTPPTTDIISATNDHALSAPSTSPASPPSPASWRIRATPRPRLLRMLTEPTHYSQQQYQDKNSGGRLMDDQHCLTSVSPAVASGSTALVNSSASGNNNNNNGSSSSTRHHHHHHTHDLTQSRRMRARAPSVGSVSGGSGWSTLSIRTQADERRRMHSEMSPTGTVNILATTTVTTSPLASPTLRTTSLTHSRRRSNSVMQTGPRLAVGLSSPPQHHHHQHQQSNATTVGHATAMDDQRASSSAIFRKSLVSIPTDSERRRDGGTSSGGELFMVKAAPVTGLTTEDVVEQMRICGSTSATPAATVDSVTSASDQQHKSRQDATLVMAVNVDPVIEGAGSVRESNAASTTKRSMEPDSHSLILPNAADATASMEATTFMHDSGVGSSQGSSQDSGDIGSGASSDQWQLPSPVWKRARMRSDDDRTNELMRDVIIQEDLVLNTLQPSSAPSPTEDVASHQPTHGSDEPSELPMSVGTLLANDATPSQNRIDEPASLSHDASTPINTHPPSALPSPTTHDPHTRSRTFSPPSLLEAFTSPEPILSPIQSYFGSDPYSPLTFSFPRHDHYLAGPIITDIHNNNNSNSQSGDDEGSRIPIDDYHGFATQPWSEQSTPSHVLSHRWTRRVASADGVPVLNSTTTANHEEFTQPRHHQHHIHSNRYERATTRRSRQFVPAMVDRPWHDLRSTLPFTSLSTAAVTTRTNTTPGTAAAPVAPIVVGNEDDRNASDSDDLYETDRDLVMDQERLSSRSIAEVEDQEQQEGGEDEEEEEDDLDVVIRAMQREALRLRALRRQLEADTRRRRRNRTNAEEDREGGEEEDESILDSDDELVSLDDEEDDELEIGSYDGYGEYEMAYNNSFDHHNHNLRYSDDDEDLEDGDDEEFGYGSYQLSGLRNNPSSTSVHRNTSDQHTMAGSSSFSFPSWSRSGGGNARSSSSSHSRASLSHSSSVSATQQQWGRQQPRRGRYVFHGFEDLDPGLELQDLDDDIDHEDDARLDTSAGDQRDDNGIEVDDDDDDGDIESFPPLDEDEEDELALMLGYENRHRSRRQAAVAAAAAEAVSSTLSEWRSSTWRMPRIGTAHHPGQSTTALSSDQYDGGSNSSRDESSSQLPEESDEMLARRLQDEEYANALRQRDAWLHGGSFPYQPFTLPLGPLQQRLSRSNRRATASSSSSSTTTSQSPPTVTNQSPSSMAPPLHESSPPSLSRRSLLSFTPRLTTSTSDHTQASSSTSLSSPPAPSSPSEQPTANALRRNRPTTTTSTATTSTPRLYSSQSRWHTSSTRSRLLVRMLEDRPRLASMARRRRYRTGEDSLLTLSSPWMEQIWGNPADYLDDDQVDESYEGLLRLSEQIGDAKPRGVPTKVLRMLDRHLFSWQSLHDLRQNHHHSSMINNGTTNNNKAEQLVVGAVKLSSSGAQHQQHYQSNGSPSSSSSSAVPPHPLVVRKVRSVSQLKSSAGTGNTPLSATASTSGATLAAASSSSLMAARDSNNSGSSAHNNNNDSGNIRQLRRVTRRISQDCLRSDRALQYVYPEFGVKYHVKADVPDLPGLADTCTICLQTYEAKDWLRPLPCRHAFHMGCIDTWLSNNCQCPICRQEVNQTRVEDMLRGEGGGGHGRPSIASS